MSEKRPYAAPILLETYEVKDFTCPRCGSHQFGSSVMPSGVLERQCHGYLANAPCGFSWTEGDDLLYMQPTGERRPLRFLRGARGAHR